MITNASPASKDKNLADSEQRRQFIRKLTLLISGGMFIDGFILGGIGIVMPVITKDLNLTLAWQGLIGASALIGIFVGGPLGGFLADKVGRKPMFAIDLAIFLVGSIAQFFVSEAWQLFAVRLVMGMAIGADYAVGWPLLAEFAPARMRGRLLSIQQLGWYVGYLVAYALGYILTVSSIANWNVILGLSTIPTAIVFLMRLGTPESPRWLVSKGRSAEAKSIAAQYMELEDQRDVMIEPVHGKQGFRQLFARGYLSATVFVSVFWVCIVTPYFAIGTFAPVVLQKLGMEDGLAGGLAFNIVTVLGTIFTILLIERVGRRKLAIPPFWISAIALAALGLFADTSVLLVVLCVLVFSFVNAINGTVVAVYPGEIFPTEIRGAGVGFATAISRIGAAAGTFLLPLSINELGVSTTMLIAAGISLIGGVVSQFLAPETMGKQLSETSTSN